MTVVMSKLRLWGLALLSLMLLVACGGGGGGDAGTPILTNGTGTGTGTGGTGTTPVVTLTMQLQDTAGTATTAVVAGQPVRAKAVLLKDGKPVVGEIVQFSVVQTVSLVSLTPTSGSQLTDSNGAASLSVASLGASTGAGQVTAAATVSGQAVTASANFYASGSVGTQPTTLTLGAVSVKSASVSAYGTTGVEVQVLQNGQPYTSPVTVSFTSSCAAGKATVSSSATTRPDGVAVGTFVDNGCAQIADSSVAITASIGSDAKTGTVLVKAPTAGSLRFVSAVPADKSITLRGQGGNGRQENAVLTFKLVDVAGNGVADADVCFDVTTYIGGLNLDGFSPATLPAQAGSGALCGTDVLSVVRYVKRTNADGTVAVQINSGTVPTPVRVRARTLYPVASSSQLETYSDTLSISTGLPIQRSFSLSVDKANIDGGSFDGEVATLTVRLADQFSNPVPDGTVVNFIASGGAVCTADNGSCKTTNGSCSCQFTSQARRPTDGRVVVLAYAVGLEDFNDSNGNNVYDAGADTFSDLADAYVDANKDGVPASGNAANGNNPTINGDTDVLVPFQKNAGYQYNGDGVRGSAHIRSSAIIYLSQASTAGTPTVILPLAQLSRSNDLLTGGTSSYFLRLEPICPQGSPVPQASLSMVLDDGFGNPMASTTSLTVVDASDNVAPAGFRPSAVQALGARAPTPLLDQPNLPKVVSPVAFDIAAGNLQGQVATAHSVTVRGVTDKCSGPGSFGLQVKSPRGGDALARVIFDGESRNVARATFPVRYTSVVNLSVTVNNSLVTIGGANWVGPANGKALASFSIDWDDGTSVTGTTSTIPTSARSHTYAAAAGARTVRLVVTDLDGQSYSGSASVTIR